MNKLCPTCGHAACRRVSDGREQWFGSVATVSLDGSGHYHAQDQWANPYKCANCGTEATFIGKSACPVCYDRWTK